jgi:sugar O-acyltransferase (sialic acid O-acetyltransferase NeuD family)
VPASLAALDILVIGVASPYAWEVVESAARLGHEVTCVDNHGGADPRLPGLTAVTDVTDRDRPFALGLASAVHRPAALRAAAAAGFTRPLALVDPHAVVARSATIGHGVYVNAGAVVGANTKLGCAVNVNRSASVGHDNDLAVGVSVGPGATTGGSVRIGASTLLGVGAVVLPGVTIGESCTIGGGAVVVADVEPGAVVVGNPARVTRHEELGRIAPCPYC